MSGRERNFLLKEEPSRGFSSHHNIKIHQVSIKLKSLRKFSICQVGGWVVGTYLHVKCYEWEDEFG